MADLENISKYLNENNSSYFLDKDFNSCYVNYCDWAFNNDYKPVGRYIFKWEICKKYNLVAERKNKKTIFRLHTS